MKQVIVGFVGAVALMSMSSTGIAQGAERSERAAPQQRAAPQAASRASPPRLAPAAISKAGRTCIRTATCYGRA